MLERVGIRTRHAKDATRQALCLLNLPEQVTSKQVGHPHTTCEAISSNSNSAPKQILTKLFAQKRIATYFPQPQQGGASENHAIPMPIVTVSGRTRIPSPAFSDIQVLCRLGHFLTAPKERSSNSQRRLSLSTEEGCRNLSGMGTIHCNRKSVSSNIPQLGLISSGTRLSTCLSSRAIWTLRLSRLRRQAYSEMRAIPNTKESATSGQILPKGC